MVRENVSCVFISCKFICIFESHTRYSNNVIGEIISSV